MNRCTHAAVDLLLGKAHIPGAKRYVFIHRFLKKLVLGVLKYQSHLKTHLPNLFRIRPDILLIKENTAAGRL